MRQTAAQASTCTTAVVRGAAQRILLMLAAAGLGGCGQSPTLNKANTKLQYQNLKLAQTNATLAGKIKRQHKQIAALQSQLSKHAGTLPTLPPPRLAELFTIHRVSLLGTTCASAFDRTGPDRGYRVFVRTFGPGGMVLPAAGPCSIAAFDLAIVHGSQRIGGWKFTAAQMKKDWYGMLGLNQFAFNCPWKHAPAHPRLTFKLKFVDALTGRVFRSQKVVVIHVKKISTALSSR